MKTFWTNASGSLKLDPGALLEFLKEQGFGIMKHTAVNGTILVKIDGRIVRIVNPNEIRKFCWDYVDCKYEFSDPEEKRHVKNLLIRERAIFSKENMSLLESVEVHEVIDTQDVSYLFFKNCALKITNKGVKKVTHNSIPGHFFESDIIDFDFDTEDMDNRDGMFRQFMTDITLHENPEI